jgi:hypothetical protein
MGSWFSSSKPLNFSGNILHGHKKPHTNKNSHTKRNNNGMDWLRKMSDGAIGKLPSGGGTRKKHK